jgi:hypothetical protein
MEQGLYKVSKVDWILAVVLLAASVGISLSLSNGNSHAGGSAAVYCDGSLVGSYDLSHDRVITREAGGHEIRLEINGGRIRIADSDCPRQICTHAGWISRPNQTIVCVPNKILIEITGRTKSDGCDAVSY